MLHQRIAACSFVDSALYGELVCYYLLSVTNAASKPVPIIIIGFA